MSDHFTPLIKQSGTDMKIFFLSAIVLLTASISPNTASAYDTSAECIHGTALLNNDAQAWQAVYTQSVRLYDNIKRFRDDVNAIIELEEDIGRTDSDARKVQKVTGTIAPAFELAPEIQNALEDVSEAAGIAHKDVISPIYKIASDLVKATKLREIRDQLDKEVLPRVAKFEKFTTDNQLRVTNISKDYIETCHAAEIVATQACSSDGFKAIAGVYTLFKAPISDATRGIIELAKVLSDINSVLETNLEPALRPIKDIVSPMKAISHAFKSVDHEIYLFDRELDKRITLKIGLFEHSFTIKYLLKEWRKEVKKFEAIVKISTIKREIRHKIDEILDPTIHRMTGFLHSLEKKVTIDGLNIDEIGKLIQDVKNRMAIEMPIIDFQIYDRTGSGLSLQRNKIKSCT